jgi:hypothetical protein
MELDIESFTEDFDPSFKVLKILTRVLRFSMN